MTVRQDYTNESIDATATGQTEIGPVSIHQFGGAVFAKRVTAQQNGGAADAAFNVNLDGNAIFSDSQVFSQSNTFETFNPNQNRYASGSNVSLEADVQTAGSSGNLLIGVLLETDNDEQV